ncbi:alcohol dehydrogenase catalytic domain-containing protein [Maribacter sp. 2307ULW6-5]|uniref:alcohol dehydrogenase catalytic domain-containing protein n=1 Tax=Maribacter sp. 2307ULW6-5 TaxID=3386275 RepID=UPI0039BCFC53
MKVWNVLKAGSLGEFKLQEQPTKQLNKNSVRIQNKAIGVNPADLMQVMGTHQNPPPLPFSPGFEMAGVVKESTSSKFKNGDRVVAYMGHGAYQEVVNGKISK